MKKSIFSLSLIAAMALSSCSSDEPAVNGGEDNGNGDARYLAVNIVSPKESGSRAGTDSGFDNGSTDENGAKTGLFLFFDERGNSTQSPQMIELGWTNNGSETPAVENISEAVLVIAGNTAPSKVLVILNAPERTESWVNGQSLSEIRSRIHEYGISDPGKFIMTNSVYLDGTDEVSATDIKNKTFKTKEEAQANSVKIYVERVLAKVKTSSLSDEKFKNNGASLEKFEGHKENVQLDLDIEGIEIANIAKTSYLVKNIAGNEQWAKDWSDWNDANNKRSYWATSPSNLIYINQSWNEIQDKDLSEKTFYVQENTTGQKTAVLITATLKDKEGKAFTFVKYGGRYFSKDGFLKQAAQLLSNAGFRESYNEEGKVKYRTIDPEELRWLSNEEHAAKVEAGTLKGYEATVVINKLKEDATGIAKLEGDTYTSSTPNAVNNFLLEKQNLAWVWEGGKCYYFKNIEHFGPNNTKTGGKNFDEGVVRNHIYELALNSVKGPGVPVYNPDEDIIPEKPHDDLFYLSATINILKWKVVKQTVDFTFE